MIAADVGQALIAALEEVRQLLVVEAEELENGRVQVVDVDAILDRADRTRRWPRSHDRP